MATDGVPENRREEVGPSEIETGDYIYDAVRRQWITVAEVREAEGIARPWRTERIFDESSSGERFAFVYRPESDWLRTAGVREDRLVTRRKLYVLADDDEPVPVSAIREGDILLDPRDEVWKRVAYIEEGTVTTSTFGRGSPSVEHDPYRQIFLADVNSSGRQVSSLRSDYLYYRDIEVLLVRKKNTHSRDTT